MFCSFICIYIIIIFGCQDFIVQYHLFLLFMIDQQQKLLEDAKKAAKQQAYFMRKALDNADLRNGLKHAALMLTQLKTSILAPRNYYILFMAIFDYMRQLQNYFKDDTRRGRKMVDVYEAVQHAPQIIPRLYLLITAGSVYIQSHQAGSQKILDDIISMMKAVQNPLRGLFLRYYFLKLCKERLPDTGSQYESENRGVKEAIETIHINLKQSTNLWMRIGGGRDKAKRQKQKTDLKMLIGQNLMRISSLQGVNIKIYKQIVLPKMLQLIQNSKDAMSQEYLLDCMIQGFPQEFHFNTLPQLLNTCSKECQKDMDMKSIFIALMNRLSSYLSDSGNVIENIQNGFSVYELFSVNIKELVKRSQANEVKNTLNLYAAFLQFTLKCYPQKHEYVDEILGDASNYCSQYETSIDDDCQLYISKFLTQPLQTMANIILTMKQYPKLIRYLKFKRKREVAKHITRAIVKGNIDLTDQTMVTQVLTFIQPLLVKLPDYETVSDLIFKEEQILVSKIVFQINSDDPGVNWAILKKFIDKFVNGGDQRMKFTIPSTLFRLFQLCIQIYNGRDESTQPKVYKRIFDASRVLLGKLTNFPQIAIKIYLQLLLLINVIDETKFYDEYTYQTAVQCLTIYEQQVTDAKQKKQVLQLIINSCLRLNCLSEQNYDTLITNIISFCSKIMKKNEQCQILLSCCYLFTNPLADSNRINQVLKRCAKLANNCISQSLVHLSLFFEILQTYLYFSKQKNIIEDKDDAISQIAAVVEQKLQEEAEEADVRAHLSQCKIRWVELSHKIKQ